MVASSPRRGGVLVLKGANCCADGQQRAPRIMSSNFDEEIIVPAARGRFAPREPNIAPRTFFSPPKIVDPEYICLRVRAISPLSRSFSRVHASPAAANATLDRSRTLENVKCKLRPRRVVDFIRRRYKIKRAGFNFPEPAGWPCYRGRSNGNSPIFN